MSWTSVQEKKHKGTVIWGFIFKWEAGFRENWDKEGEGKQGNTGISGWLDTMSLLWSKHTEIPIAHLTLTWLVSFLIWRACQRGRTNWGREHSTTNYSCWICRPSLFFFFFCGYQFVYTLVTHCTVSQSTAWFQFYKSALSPIKLSAGTNLLPSVIQMQTHLLM